MKRRGDVSLYCSGVLKTKGVKLRVRFDFVACTQRCFSGAVYLHQMPQKILQIRHVSAQL